MEKSAPLSGEAARPLGYDFSDDKENLIDLLLDADRGWMTLFLAFSPKFTGGKKRKMEKDVNSHKDDRKYVSQTLKLMNPDVMKAKPMPIYLI